MSADQAGMDTGKIQTIVDNLRAHIQPVTAAAAQVLAAVQKDTLAGGDNDPLATAFATSYYPLADDTNTVAQAVPGQLGDLTQAGMQCVDDYKSADQASAQCFPK